MDFITIRGQKILVDVVHHDSMEEPESACTNRLISVKAGEKTYHRLTTATLDVGREMGELVQRVVTDLGKGCGELPPMLTVMVTSFAKEFVIDWPASVSAMTKAALLGVNVIPSTQAMADFERKPL